MRGLVNVAGLNAGVTDLSDLFRSSVFNSFDLFPSSDEAARGLGGAFVFISPATSLAADRIVGRETFSLMGIVSGSSFSELDDPDAVADFCFAAETA